MGWHRYVALGDSFTEGVGDVEESRPNQVRGWADRVAEVLATTDDDFGYANLAIRGRKLLPIIDEQLPAALELEPDLVTVHGAGNDILRPSVDIDALLEAYAEMVETLTDTGATVLMWTAFGARKSRFYKPLRGRFAYFNEGVREIADDHGATIVDYWRMREYDDWGYWDRDRLHMSAPGHALMAIKVLDLLGVEHRLPAPNPIDYPVLTGRAKRAADRQWATEHLAPWVKRRLTGASSGDNLSARYPQLSRPV
ncbi:MAG: SGNH/GDSL hydrolase family protein [Nocardioides sp.]